MTHPVPLSLFLSTSLSFLVTMKQETLLYHMLPAMLSCSLPGTPFLSIHSPLTLDNSECVCSSLLPLSLLEKVSLSSLDEVGASL